MDTYKKVAKISSIKPIYNRETSNTSLLLNCTGIDGVNFIASTAKEWLEKQEEASSQLAWAVNNDAVVELTLERSVKDTTKYKAKGEDGKMKEHTHKVDRESVVGIQTVDAEEFNIRQRNRLAIEALSSASSLPESVQVALAGALGTAMSSK